MALTADAIGATKSAWADKISSFQKNYLRRIQKFDAADFYYNTLGTIFTMAKHSKKAKGPQRSENDAAKLKNGLSELTSQIQEKLNGNPYNKRKNPPTEASGKQKQRKQRDSEGVAPPAKSNKADEDALLAEIKALGGDEEDWRLINEVASDDEAVASESKAPVDKRLKEELAALSKELGFAGFAPADASDDEEEEEGDQEEEEDEDEDSDDDVSEDNGKNKEQNKKQNNSKANKESKEKGPAENDMRRVEGLVSRYP